MKQPRNPITVYIIHTSSKYGDDVRFDSVWNNLTLANARLDVLRARQTHHKLDIPSLRTAVTTANPHFDADAYARIHS